MPAGVKRAGPRWAIYNRDTGKVYGYSASKAKAQSSANARNAGSHGWKATGRKGKA